MRPFNHQSILHAIRSHRTVLQCEALGISTQSRLSLRFPASKHVCGWHLSLSSFSLRQVISRRRFSAALLQEALASHGTQRFPPKFMAFNEQPDLICSLLLQRGETAFKTLPFLQPWCQKIDARSHEHTGRIRCTWGTACVAHVSRCLRVVFPETSWTFQRLLGHFCKGGVGISYPHASGLLLANYTATYRLRNVDILVPASLPNTAERLKEDERSAFSHFLVSQMQSHQLKFNTAIPATQANLECAW